MFQKLKGIIGDKLQIGLTGNAIKNDTDGLKITTSDGNTLKNVLIAEPTADSHGATRKYVDDRTGAAAGGWIYFYDAAGRNGAVISAEVYQDAGNNVLQSFTTSGADISLLIRASFPLIKLNGDAHTLTKDATDGFYEGTVDVTVTGNANYTANVVLPDGQNGAGDTVAVTYDAPPELLTLSFTGGYPGSQTELKAGDTVTITGTTDKDCTGIEILDYEACVHATATFTARTEFTVSGVVIADRGDTAVARPARVRARNAAGGYGNTRDTNTGGGSTDMVHVVTCNDLHPTATFGTITYPSTQSALKDSETASVAVTLANLDTVNFTSPNSQLSVTDPTVIETPKTVTRIAGDYNISTNNLQVVATRNANAAQTTANTVVCIAHVAATISVTEPYTRLRSGGADGTAIQEYTITITSDQALTTAPSLDKDAGANTGTWKSGSNWTGGPTVWTRIIQINDSDNRGTFNWTSLSVTNKAGKSTTSITGNATYTIGGFVARNITFSVPFSATATMNVAVSDYSKLEADTWSSTSNAALKNATQGNTDNILDTYTVTSIGDNPTTIYWNDVAARNTNSGGTAQLLGIEEVV